MNLDGLAADFEDFIVECADPKQLDRTIQQIGPAAVHQDSNGGYIRHGSGYLVRCFGNSGFIKFVIEKQGYGRIVKANPPMP